MVDETQVLEEIKNGITGVNRLNNKLNESVKLRYKIIQRKKELWDTFSGFGNYSFVDRKAIMENWMKEFLELTKKEEELVKVFQMGVDNILASIKSVETLKGEMSDEFNLIFSKLDLSYKKCDDIIKKYEGRVLDELKLEDKESRKKLGYKFIKKIYAFFKEEIDLEASLFKELENDYLELKELMEEKKAVLIIAKSDLQKMAFSFLVDSIKLLGIWASAVKLNISFDQKQFKEFILESDELEKIVEEGFF